MQTTESPAKQLIKAKPLARALDCGVSTVHALAKAGKIPSISIGKLGVRFDLQAVLEALRR
jgi:hypothetical protein